MSRPKFKNTTNVKTLGQKLLREMGLSGFDISRRFEISEGYAWQILAGRVPGKNLRKLITLELGILENAWFVDDFERT